MQQQNKWPKKKPKQPPKAVLLSLRERGKIIKVALLSLFLDTKLTGLQHQALTLTLISCSPWRMSNFTLTKINIINVVIFVIVVITKAKPLTDEETPNDWY